MRGCLGASFKRNEVELEAADPEMMPPPSSFELRSCVAPLKAGTLVAAPTRESQYNQDGVSRLPAGASGLPRPSGRGSHAPTLAVAGFSRTSRLRLQPCRPRPRSWLSAPVLSFGDAFRRCQSQ